MNTTRVKSGVCRSLIYLFLILISATMLIPFLWMLTTSLKHTTEVFREPFQWLPSAPRWSNYAQVWTKVPFGVFYWNTIKLSVLITGLQMLTSAMAAFAFAKLRFPGKNQIFLGYLATMMVPIQVLMIPQFILMKSFGLTNSHLPIILLQSFTPFGVFLLRQFIQGVPTEMLEAAKMDGAGYAVIFIRMVLPLSKPAMFALGLITFIGTWNDFMIPMIYLDDLMLRTITLGIRTFSNEYGADYGLTMAATVSALAPMILVYLIGQKQILKGIALGSGGGLKG